MMTVLFMRVLALLCVSFGLFPTLSLAEIVPPSDSTNIQYSRGDWTIPGAPPAGSSAVEALQCPAPAASARTSTVGARFSFKFSGSMVSIVTAAGPGQASYNVTRDGDAPVAIRPSVYEQQTCRVTFQSTELIDGEHTITVIVTEPGEFALQSIVYEASSSKDDKKPLNQTVTIAIAVSCIVGFLAILGAVICLCCRGRNRKEDIEKMSLRYKNNSKGLLTTTPTFIQYPTKRKDSEETLAVNTGPKDRSGTPVSQHRAVHPYAPSAYVPPPQRQTSTMQTQTQASQVATAFSV